MASLKQKGDLAELKVAADLMERGCRISIPFGEDCDYDLIADYEGRLHRVQVKHTRSDGHPTSPWIPAEKWSQPDSNRRPPPCKGGALPTELWPRLLIVGRRRQGPA
jgi:hypothetical protein